MVGIKNNMGSKNRSMSPSAGWLTHHFTLSHSNHCKAHRRVTQSLQLTVRSETAAHTNTRLGFLPERSLTISTVELHARQIRKGHNFSRQLSDVCRVTLKDELHLGTSKNPRKRFLFKLAQNQNPEILCNPWSRAGQTGQLELK